jgi:PhnB protein
MADELDDRALTAIAALLDGCPSGGFRTRLRETLERSISMTTSSAVRVQGARVGFTAVTPYLIAPDIEPVIAFAKEVFGAEETHRTIGSAGGTHCELRIGDSILMLGGGRSPGVDEGRFPRRVVGLHVYVEDVDAVFQRALDAGAESLGAPADRPYGERSGFVKDQAGNHWYIATHQGPTYFAEGPRTVTPNLYVQRTAVTGAPAFIEFVKAAFNARVELRYETPQGLVGHAVVRIGDAALEIGEGQAAQFSAPASFYLYVDDCDAVYAQAIQAGGTSLHPPADQPYGDRMGGVADRWGNEWFIATHVGAP